MTKGINLVLWSMNRATQLDLLLRALRRNAAGLFDSINIIVRSTAQTFEDGYDLLGLRIGSDEQDRYPDCPIYWYMERDLKKQTLEAIDTGLKFTCMMTDDDVVYRNIWGQIKKRDLFTPEGSKTIGILEMQDLACLSLRMGFNTYLQTYDDPNSRLPDWYYLNSGPFYFWKHKGATGNLGYALSLDAHIFQTDVILPLVESTNFKTPNELEAGLSGKTHKLPNYMGMLENSVVAASPSNSVALWNRAGVHNPYGAEYLNNMYLDGHILDLDFVMSQRNEIRSTHFEFKHLWKEYRA